MDAPIYPPSAAYHEPVRLPELLSSKTTTINDLLSNPAAKAIILREIPGFESRISNPMLKPHLGAFSLRSLVQFGMFKSEDLDRVDVALKALPQTGGAL